MKFKKIYEGMNVLYEYMKAFMPLTAYECCSAPITNPQQQNATTQHNNVFNHQAYYGHR